MEAATHTCTTCGKSFKNALGLSGHKRSHLKDKKPVDFTKPVEAERKIEAQVEAPQVEDVKPPEVIPSIKYKLLPPPMVDHLEKTFGNWLKYFEVGQEYRNDFGGYAMYIKVPKEYSTEWKEIRTMKYDNETRRPLGEFTEVIPDVRYVSLKDLSKAIQYVNLVKHHIIENAYRKGIRLPTTNVGIDETRMTKEQYETAVAGQPS